MVNKSSIYNLNLKKLFKPRYLNSSRYLAQDLLGNLYVDIICSNKRTLSYKEQISGGHCAYYLWNICCNMQNFENWGISLGHSPVLDGHIQSRDAFWSIAREQKYICSSSFNYLLANTGGILNRWSRGLDSFSELCYFAFEFVPFWDSTDMQISL